MTWFETIPMAHERNPHCAKMLTEEGCFYCCAACNYDRHECPGCGHRLTHLGHEMHTEVEWDPKTMEVIATYVIYTKHEGCTDG